MRGASAAECDQAVAAKVDPLFRRMGTGRRRHVLVDHVVDAPGDPLDRHLQARGEPFRDRVSGVAGCKRHVAAEEILGIEITEQQVRVGNRGLFAAEAIAGRPRRRAGGPRPDVQKAEIVDLGDAAATGADLQQLDRQDLQRQAAAALEAVHVANLELVGDRGLAVFDHRYLRRGAAHVEGDGVGDVERGAGEIGRRDGARGRAGLDHPDGEGFGTSKAGPTPPWDSIIAILGFSPRSRKPSDKRPT